MLAGDAQAVLGRRIALAGGAAEPAHRLGRVVRRTLTVDVSEAELELTVGVAAVSGAAKPAHRLGRVFRHTLALLVSQTEIVLRPDEALLGRLEPAHPLGEVAVHPVPREIGQTENVLRRCEALLGRSAEPAHALDGILDNTEAAVVAGAEIGLCSRVALLGRLAIPEHGLDCILRDAEAVLVTGAEQPAGLGNAGLRRLAPQRQTPVADFLDVKSGRTAEVEAAGNVVDVVLHCRSQRFAIHVAALPWWFSGRSLAALRAGIRSARASQAVENVAGLLDLVQRHPLVAGVGAGDVAGAKDHRGNASGGQGRGIGSIRHGQHLMRPATASMA